MSWDRYALTVLAVTGAAVLAPVAAVAALIYATRSTK